MKRSDLEVYHAKDGWRWRLRAKNGEIVADSGEAYKNCWNAKRAAKRLRWIALFSRIEVQ